MGKCGKINISNKLFSIYNQDFDHQLPGKMPMIELETADSSVYHTHFNGDDFGPACGPVDPEPMGHASNKHCIRQEGYLDMSRIDGEE